MSSAGPTIQGSAWLQCRPPPFVETFRADRQLARHRNANFSSSALLSHNGGDHVVLGTTLGDLYMLSLSILGGLGQQELASVNHSSVEAHPKVNALCNISGSGASHSIASSGSDGCIKLWRMQNDGAKPDATLEEVSRLEIPWSSAEDLAQPRPPDALCLAAVADGSMLRAGSSAGSVLTYDLAAQGHPQPTNTHSAHVSAITDIGQHPENPNIFCSASVDGTAALWDARAAENGGCVSRVCPCAEAAGGPPARAPLPPTADAYRAVLRGTPASMRDAVECCEFDQSGRWLALGCADGTLRYFSTLTHVVTGTLQLSSAPQALCRNTSDLCIGCAQGELYTGGFLAADVSSLQEHVVRGRPALTSIVAQQRPAGQAGMVVACGTPGTVLGMNSLLRIPLCTVQSRLDE